MPHAGYVNARPIEYVIIHEAEPIRPRIGLLQQAGKCEWIVDAFGQRYLYAGVMPRRWDGRLMSTRSRPASLFCCPASFTACNPRNRDSDASLSSNTLGTGDIGVQFSPSGRATSARHLAPIHEEQLAGQHRRARLLEHVL